MDGNTKREANTMQNKRVANKTEIRTKTCLLSAR